MGKIEFFDPDVDIKVLRATNEEADVELRIKAQDTSIVINVGHWQGNVQDLRDTLARVLETLDSEILDGWLDTPEQNDGYVTFDDGAYHVSLDGKPIGNRHGFPRRDIAMYELASAMINAKYFPNAWQQRESGVDPINDIEQLFTDDSGLAPLEGVEYEPDDQVTTPDGLTWTVDRDYGHLGVTLYISGDPSVRTFIEDRTDITREEEQV